MPVVTPHKGESQDKFMGRCMSMMNEENQGRAEKRSKKQMVAICFSQWREMHGGETPETTSEEIETKDKE